LRIRGLAGCFPVKHRRSEVSKGKKRWFLWMLRWLPLCVWWSFCLVNADYENYYPKNKKEIPKANEQKKESKGTSWPFALTAFLEGGRNGQCAWDIAFICVLVILLIWVWLCVWRCWGFLVWTLLVLKSGGSVFSFLLTGLDSWIFFRSFVLSISECVTDIMKLLGNFFVEV